MSLAQHLPPRFAPSADTFEAFLDAHPGERLDVIKLREVMGTDDEMTLSLVVTAAVMDNRAKCVFVLHNLGRDIAEFDHIVDIPDEGMLDPVEGKPVYGAPENLRMEVLIHG